MNLIAVLSILAFLVVFVGVPFLLLVAMNGWKEVKGLIIHIWNL